MSDKRTKALIKAAQYVNDCLDLGISAGEIIAFSKRLQAPFDEPESEKQHIEKGKEERDTSPTPLLEREEKQKDNPSLARAREELCAFNQFFASFWSAYPVGHKTNKKTCCDLLRSRFFAAKDQAAFINAVLNGLDKWKHCSRWLEGFICHPQTFINQERWLDDAPNDEKKTAHTFRKVSGVSQTANTHANKDRLTW